MFKELAVGQYGLFYCYSNSGHHVIMENVTQPDKAAFLLVEGIVSN
ncbi:hypothetical protein [Paenibacillus tyrfis]|nr:hypothetical protein [Paenibacillus tyrfis]MCP1311493.1 hypothetical protein [Paenibacillus tyrfis]